MKWILAAIGAVGAVGVGFVLVIVTIPTQGDSFFGGCLLVFGSLHVLLYRRIGTSAFRQTQAMPEFIARVWNEVGESGVQHLYLGIGITTLSAGIFLLVRAYV
jgi:hypothetical protein